MSNQIERLRYYDGEYLRSYDFTDEQAYHIEMRRRLNHRLHLHGIVYGLQLVPDQDSPAPPAPPFFSISPGMAIDQIGREIFLPAPYPLSSENVLNRPGLNPGETYEVWLCYREAQTGLPAAGYRDCNEKNQQTRWRETFQVTLKPVNPGKNSYIPPDCGGVRLGTITLDKNDNSQIVSMTNTGRVFVGIRAQRLIAADQEPDTTFKVEKQNVDPTKRVPLPGYVEVEPGVFARGNLLIEKNVVIGDDFPGATDPKLPSPKHETGNLKITNDLFLNGDFYGHVGDKWLGIKEYVQSLMPDVRTGKVEIDVVPVAGHPTTDTVHETVKTSLSAFQFPPRCMVAPQWIDWQDSATLQNWFKGLAAGDITLRLQAQAQKIDSQSIDLEITWTIGPEVQLVALPALPTLPVKKLKVGYIVVFTP